MIEVSPVNWNEVSPFISPGNKVSPVISPGNEVSPVISPGNKASPFISPGNPFILYDLKWNLLIN